MPLAPQSAFVVHSEIAHTLRGMMNAPPHDVWSVQVPPAHVSQHSS